MEGVIATKIVTEVHSSRQILAGTLGSKQLAPVVVVCDGIESCVVANSEPAVVAASINDNREDRIVVDISIAVLELLRTCSVGTPACSCTDDIVCRRNLNFVQRSELDGSLGEIVLTGFAHNGNRSTIGDGIEDDAHISSRRCRIASDVIEISILQSVRRERDNVGTIEAVGIEHNLVGEFRIGSKLYFSLQNRIGGHSTLGHFGCADRDGCLLTSLSVDEVGNANRRNRTTDADVAHLKLTLGEIGLGQEFRQEVLIARNQHHAQQSHHV